MTAPSRAASAATNRAKLLTTISLLFETSRPRGLFLPRAGQTRIHQRKRELGSHGVDLLRLRRFERLVSPVSVSIVPRAPPPPRVPGFLAI